MLQTLRLVASLLLSTAFLLASIGLLGTLVPLRGSEIGFSETLLGGLAGAYYAGFLVGTFTMPKLVQRIGHIRAFAFGTICAAAVALLHALAEWPWLWLILRFVDGIVMVGLYTIIESWLNARASPTQRGTIFAIYMTVNSGGLALSQPLLRIDGQPFVLFTVVSLLSLLAALPVILTHQPQPSIQDAPRLALKRVFQVAPTAGVGALLAGLALGAFFGLAPVYASQIGFDTVQISNYMLLGILGGALLQWPLGYASDRIDRRLMLAWVGVASCLLAVGLALGGDQLWLELTLIFAYCGAAFAVYPMAVTHLVDYLHPEELLGASSSVYLIYGAGSVLGPLVAGVAMRGYGAIALPLWFALIGIGLGIYAAYRYHAYQREQVAANNFRPVVVSTTATALSDVHADADMEAPMVSPEGADLPGPERMILDDEQGLS